MVEVGILSIENRGLYRYLIDESGKPDISDPLYDKWIAENSLVMSRLLQQPHISRGYMLLSTAQELWSAVAQTYSLAAMMPRCMNWKRRCMKWSKEKEALLSIMLNWVCCGRKSISMRTFKQFADQMQRNINPRWKNCEYSIFLQALTWNSIKQELRFMEGICSLL